MLSIPLNDIRSNGFGSTVTIKVPKGWTYHCITLKLQDIPLEFVKNIRVLLNGQPFQRFRDGIELAKFNAYDEGTDALGVAMIGGELEAGYGHGNDDVMVGSDWAKPDSFHYRNGHLNFHFDRLKMKTRIGEQMTAIGTGLPLTENNPFPVNTFTIEFDLKEIGSLESDGAYFMDIKKIKAAARRGELKTMADVTAMLTPEIKATAEVSDPSPTGYVMKKRTFEYDVAGEGEFQISDLPKFGRINRIFIADDTGYVPPNVKEELEKIESLEERQRAYIPYLEKHIKKVKVERDTYKVFERTADENTRIQNTYGHYTTNNMFIIDPTEKGYSDEGLSVLYKDGREVQDFRLIIDVARKTHLSLTVEYISQLGD